MRADGARYESLALSFLERAGLRLVQRNFTCRFGEIDLVMREGDTVVFVEVRFRRGGEFGKALDSVAAPKRAKLVRAAGMFLAANPALARQACRFDVVALDGHAPPDWCRHAFET